MFFHQTILIDGSVAGTAKFKIMGSLILLSLKNTTNSTVTGKFNWATTITTEEQQFYYADKGFKTGCYDGAGDVINGHFSENAIVNFNDTNPTEEHPAYSIALQKYRTGRPGLFGGLVRLVRNVTFVVSGAAHPA